MKILPSKKFQKELLKAHLARAKLTENMMKKDYFNLYTSTLDSYLSIVKANKGDFEAIQRDIRLNPTNNAETKILTKINSAAEKIRKKESRLTEEALMDIVGENYYKSIFEVQGKVGFNLDTPTLPKERIRDITHNAWAKDGKEFSSRIWSNTDKMQKDLSKIVSDGILKGEPPRVTAHKLRDSTGNSFYNCTRIIRTETNAVVTRSDSDMYKALGFDEYIINANFDNNTSDICGDLDGQKFKFSEMEIGTNAPPFHPNCRTTIEAVNIIDYEPPYKYGRDGVGNPVELPSGLTYKDWSKQYK